MQSLSCFTHTQIIHNSFMCTIGNINVHAIYTLQAVLSISLQNANYNLFSSVVTPLTSLAL